MKNKIKKITLIVFLLAVTVSIGYKVGTIAERTNFSNVVKAASASGANIEYPDNFIEEGFEEERLQVEKEIDDASSPEITKNVTGLFTDLFNLVKEVFNGHISITSVEFSDRFIDVFNGLFSVDQRLGEKEPDKDDPLNNKGFVSSAASIIWKYMDYYDTKRVMSQTMAEGVSVIKNINYAGDSDKYHNLDIYAPEGNTQKLPVIIQIHGGGLMYAEKEINRVYCSDLASKGYIVIVINYRLCPDVIYPSQVEDVISSYRWVAQNGEKYNCDLNNVFVVGDSAGGQLAFYTSVVNTSDELKTLYNVADTGLNINAVGLISGMFDMKNGINSALISCILGYDYRNSKYYPYLQPEEIIDKGELPPVYMVSSIKDFLHSSSVDLDNLLTEKGIEHQFHDWKLTINESSGHITSVAYPDLPESIETTDEMLAFFEAHMK